MARRGNDAWKAFTAPKPSDKFEKNVGDVIAGLPAPAKASSKDLEVQDTELFDVRDSGACQLMRGIDIEHFDSIIDDAGAQTEFVFGGCIAQR